MHTGEQMVRDERVMGPTGWMDQPLQKYGRQLMDSSVPQPWAVSAGNKNFWLRSAGVGEVGNGSAGGRLLLMLACWSTLAWKVGIDRYYY